MPTPQCAFMDSESGGIAIDLQGVRAAPGVLADQRCLVEIRIRRVSPDEFAAGLFGAPKPQSRFAEWLTSRHASLGRYDAPPFQHYRYDVPCSDGDIVSAFANVRFLDPDADAVNRETEAVVRRVLLSVQCGAK